MVGLFKNVHILCLERATIKSKSRVTDVVEYVMSEFSYASKLDIILDWWKGNEAQSRGLDPRIDYLAFPQYRLYYRFIVSFIISFERRETRLKNQLNLCKFVIH